MSEYFQAFYISDYSLVDTPPVRGSQFKCRQRLQKWGVKHIQEHWEMIDEDGQPLLPSFPVPDDYTGPARWNAWGVAE